MKTVLCCEECLGEPTAERVCPQHPYARLIWVDEDEAFAERFLLRELRNNRLRAALKPIAAALLVVVVFSFLRIEAVGALPAGLLLFACPAVLFFPAFWLAHRSWPRTFGRAPVWLSGLLSVEGWLLLGLYVFSMSGLSPALLVGLVTVPFLATMIAVAGLGPQRLPADHARPRVVVEKPRRGSRIRQGLS